MKLKSDMIEKAILQDSIAKIIFSNSNEGLIITNGNGVIRYANPRALKMFGYAYDELVGNPVETLVPRNLHSKHVKMRKGFEKKPDNRPMGAGMNLLGQKKDGTTLPIEISLSPFEHEGEKYVLSFISNITKRKTQEERVKKMLVELDVSSKKLQNLNKNLEDKVNERTLELAETIKKLQESEQEIQEALKREKEVNALKSKFITTASHEFRTPMSTIMSSLSLIKAYSNAPDKQERHFERIQKSVNYLLNILNDLLTIEKTELAEGLVEKEEINLVDMVNELINDLIPVYNQPDQVVKVNAPKSLWLESNEYYLRNILVNIIGNAMKFSGPKGNIEIVLKDGQDSVSIEVSDDGIGIPKEDQENIWKRFYRAHNTTQTDGTGLGLYIAFKNTELLNGSLSLESELNKGTTFYIKLPKV